MKDYYYILGVNRNASREQIKSAYRKLSLKFHPDKNDGDAFFEERFKEIQEAYEILSNTDRKKAYDSKLNHSSTQSNNNFHAKSAKKDFEEEFKKTKSEFEADLKNTEKRKRGFRDIVFVGTLLSLAFAAILYHFKPRESNVVFVPNLATVASVEETQESQKSDSIIEGQDHHSISDFLEEITNVDELELDNLLQQHNKYAYVQGNSGIYKANDNECAIDKGVLIIGNVVDGKFRFLIRVANNNGYSGSIDSIATFISDNEAVFHGENNCRLTFSFIENNKVEILEQDGNTYHGYNICFSGKYNK